jgi:hypothetical protein
MNAIIKSGANFVVSCRLVNNNFDLTLDTNINVILEHNTRVSIGGTIYLTGPMNSEINLPNNKKTILVEKDTKYHINNRDIDPLGLIKNLEHSQKFIFYSQSEIILPSETILHTLTNTLEFRLTKAIHCTLSD